MNQHLINFTEIQNLSIEELINKLSQTDGIRLQDMKLKDFIFYNDDRITSGCGVYIFKNGTDFYYVGDCSSRSFIERIPCHFDTRPEAWMNTLVKHYTKRTNNLPIDNQNLGDSATHILNNFSVILINFEERNPEKISKLERLLLSILNPINKLKKPLIFSLSDKTNNYCV